MTCFQYDVDWQAAGAVITAIAALIALYVGVWPTLVAAKQRKSRARAYGTLLAARLNRTALNAEVASRLANLEPKSVARFNTAVEWGVALDHERIAEASSQLHLFDEVLARQISAAFADMETTRVLLMPAGAPIKKALGADLAQPNLGGLLLAQAQSVNRAREGLYQFVYAKPPEDITVAAAEVVAAKDPG
ncbi:hypothetical protein [Noviluteimonas gilva]|nr:hypothetical protein [Lysobacter gilvus]